MADRRVIRQKTVWNPEMEHKLVELYHNHTNAECALLIGVSEAAVQARAWKLKLRKDKEWMIEKSRSTQFKKGSVPVNKGKTWSEYMPVQKQVLARKTCFKKGQKPHNAKPVGYERKDSRQGYWFVKVAEPNVFKPKHRVLWEQHFGPIPSGVNISFIDGNPDNVTIENLRAETMKEKFNRCCCIHTRFPTELRYIIQLKGALKRQINKLNKDNDKDGKDRKHRKTETDEKPAMGIPE